VWRGEESAAIGQDRMEEKDGQETCKGKYFLPTDTKTTVGTLKIFSIYLFYMPQCPHHDMWGFTFGNFTTFRQKIRI
jgi:hypothetical protein